MVWEEGVADARGLLPATLTASRAVAGGMEDSTKRKVREGDGRSPYRFTEVTERLNELGCEKTKRGFVFLGPGPTCFKVRATQALRLGQVYQNGELQSTGASGPSGHPPKQAP
jgi:hypothetical protein